MSTSAQSARTRSRSRGAATKQQKQTGSRPQSRGPSGRERSRSRSKVQGVAEWGVNQNTKRSQSVPRPSSDVKKQVVHSDTTRKICRTIAEQIIKISDDDRKAVASSLRVVSADGKSYRKIIGYKHYADATKALGHIRAVIKVDEKTPVLVYDPSGVGQVAVSRMSRVIQTSDDTRQAATSINKDVDVKPMKTNFSGQVVFGAFGDESDISDLANTVITRARRTNGCAWGAFLIHDAGVMKAFLRFLAETVQMYSAFTQPIFRRYKNTVKLSFVCYVNFSPTADQDADVRTLGSGLENMLKERKGKRKYLLVNMVHNAERLEKMLGDPEDATNYNIAAYSHTVIKITGDETGGKLPVYKSDGITNKTSKQKDRSRSSSVVRKNDDERKKKREQGQPAKKQAKQDENRTNVAAPRGGDPTRPESGAPARNDGGGGRQRGAAGGSGRRRGGRGGGGGRGGRGRDRGGANGGRHASNEQ